MVLGVAAALFFAVTFVVNRLMATGGGAWEWSAALRFWFTAPLLAGIVLVRGRTRPRAGLGPVVQALRRRPAAWAVWSTVGFVGFYAPLTWAAEFAPGWLVSAMWQTTIVAGVLLAPLLYADPVRRRIPARSLAISVVILAGVGLSQAGSGVAFGAGLAGAVAAILVAACCYPVGNRRTMEMAGRLDTLQRVTVMTFASLPAWLVVTVEGGLRTGLPSAPQVLGAAVVAVSSGVVATVLFFAAADLARRDPVQLAAVEATQAGEVVFTALAAPLLMPAEAPGPLAWAGVGVIVLGVVSHALAGTLRPGWGRAPVTGQ